MLSCYSMTVFHTGYGLKTRKRECEKIRNIFDNMKFEPSVAQELTARSHTHRTSSSRLVPCFIFDRVILFPFLVWTLNRNSIFTPTIKSWQWRHNVHNERVRERYHQQWLRQQPELPPLSMFIYRFSNGRTYIQHSHPHPEQEAMRTHIHTHTDTSQSGQTAGRRWR